MPLFVLDASVAISWCFPGDPTENTPYSRAILKRLAVDDAVVPEIWGFEIANNIFVSNSKRRRINEQQIREYLDLLKALPIHVEAQSLWANVDLDLGPRMKCGWGCGAQLTGRNMGAHFTICAKLPAAS
jgi:hypothetical protein